MSIAARIGRTAEILDRSEKANDFITLAKAMAHTNRAYKSLPASVPSRVQTILKAGVSPGSTTDPSWSALSDYTSIAAGFLESLRNLSVFDTLLANGMKRVPLKSRTVVATVAVTGSTPSESSVKPISAMTVGANEIAPQKAAAIIVGTAELFRLDQSGGTLFSGELRNGVAVATDTAFLASLFASVTPVASAGSTTANTPLTDIGVLLSALTLGANSRVFFVMSAANVAKLMTKVSSGSGTAYPLLRLNGGEILAV